MTVQPEEHTIRSDAPYAGVNRSVYFLAAAVVTIFVVVTGVVGIYHGPDSGSSGVSCSINLGGTQSCTPISTIDSSGVGDHGDYNRNVAIILGAISAALFTVGLVALSSAYNPLRAGLILGGLIVFLIGMGFWTGASNDWIGLPVAALNFAALAALFPFLEHGSARFYRRGPPPTPPPAAVA